MMAASKGKMVGVSEESSSDDEERRRCEEAVWNTRSVKETVLKEDTKGKQTKRVVVADHEHDGNELQVSHGFRTHVAKKLGNLLDSSITETQTETLSCVISAKCDEEDNEVPGQTAEEHPAPVRRRPVYSSSDSDSEMETRLREAAVSIKDLLPSSALPSTLSSPSKEPNSSEKIKKKAADREDNHVVKKKRKQTKEESAQVGCTSSPNAPSNSGHDNSEQELTQVKQKKKKKRKPKTVEEALN